MTKNQNTFISHDDLYDAVQSGEIDENSPIMVNIFTGPIGGCGFRSGNWTIKIGGITFSMYYSIPHQLALDKQKLCLADAVRHNIRNAIEGKTYVDNGVVRLKYHSNMTRQ